MKLGLSQALPNDGDIEGAFAHIATALEAASAAKADMVVLPELFLPGYNRPDLHRTQAQAVEGEWISRLQKMAANHGCGVTLGWAERDQDKIYNAATAIDGSGQILAHYRKIQLYGPMENASFTPGQEPPPIFTLKGIRCGLLICYDIEFHGHAAGLAERGAEAILVPTANPLGFEHVQRLLVPTRAYENGVTIAYANYCGTEAGLSFSGRSLIAGADGAVLAEAGRFAGLLIGDIPAAKDYAPDLLANLRLDYRPIG